MVAIRNIVSMQAVRSAGRLAAVRVAPLSTSASLRLKESSLSMFIIPRILEDLPPPRPLKEEGYVWRDENKPRDELMN